MNYRLIKRGPCGLMLLQVYDRDKTPILHIKCGKKWVFHNETGLPVHMIKMIFNQLTLDYSMIQEAKIKHGAISPCSNKKSLFMGFCNYGTFGKSFYYNDSSGSTHMIMRKTIKKEKEHDPRRIRKDSKFQVGKN